MLQIYLYLTSSYDPDQNEHASDSHQMQSQLAEQLLCTLAAEQLHTDRMALRLARDEHGKPYLTDFPDFHFNWSHTRGAIAIAISDSPVGIDIEGPRTLRPGLARRFYTENEQAYVSQDPSRLLEIWTRKEAYVKYTGTGLIVPLNSFDVMDDEQIAPLIRTQVHDPYILSICSQSQHIPAAICNSIIRPALHSSAEIQ